MHFFVSQWNTLAPPPERRYRVMLVQDMLQAVAPLRTAPSPRVLTRPEQRIDVVAQFPRPSTFRGGTRVNDGSNGQQRRRHQGVGAKETTRQGEATKSNDGATATKAPPHSAPKPVEKTKRARPASRRNPS